MKGWHLRVAAALLALWAAGAVVGVSHGQSIGSWCLPVLASCTQTSSGDTWCSYAYSQCASVHPALQEEERGRCVPGARRASFRYDEGMKSMVVRNFFCGADGQWREQEMVVVPDIGEPPAGVQEEEHLVYPREIGGELVIHRGENGFLDVPCQIVTGTTEDGLVFCRGVGIFAGSDVAARLPPILVQYRPYPNGLVGVPVVFAVQIPGSRAPAPIPLEVSRPLSYEVCKARGITAGPDRSPIRNLRYRLLIAPYRPYQGRDVVPIALEVRRAPQSPWVRVDWDEAWWGSGTLQTVFESASAGQPSCWVEWKRVSAYPVRVRHPWKLFAQVLYERLRKERVCTYDVRSAVAGRCDPDCSSPGEKCRPGYVKVERFCSADLNGDGVPDDACWEPVEEGLIPVGIVESTYTASLSPQQSGGDLVPYVCVPVISVQGGK